jgi:hypothetical protein
MDKQAKIDFVISNLESMADRQFSEDNTAARWRFWTVKYRDADRAARIAEDAASKARKIGNYTRAHALDVERVIQHEIARRIVDRIR